MADVTVAQFAEVLKVPVEKLISQLDEAGLSVSGAEDTISDDAKLELLTFLRRSHGKKDDPSAAAPKRITLKRKSQNELRLSGAQGRARTVNVEVRRKRTYIKRDVLEEKARKKQEELDQKRKAEEDRVADEQREIEAKRKAAEEEERLRKEQEEKARLEQEQEARRVAEQEAERRRKEEEERQRQEKIRRDREQRAKETRYGRKELHVAKDKSGQRKKRRPKRRALAVNVDSKHGFERPTAPVIREVTIPETLTVSDLANRMAVKSTEVIKIMMGMGAMVTINQMIDQDTAAIVVEEMGHTPKLLKESDVEDKLLASSATEAEELPRAPVVTIMGHVDHGKTSLLDFIRRTKVTEGEAGGITQHIGAYHVETNKGNIAFLDTPGHEAFTAMRARGAQATDIVILVVAADDGVKPQTIEAIQHAKAAEVPIVVAVNKVDLANADPERAKNELAQQEVIPEDWGGDNMFVHVSAKTGEGVDELLDAVLLQSEVLELKAQASGPARGLVIESSLERGRGAVATVLVQSGLLKTGDTVLAGKEFGRVRAMFDAQGNEIKEAGPSIPVAMLGLSGAPDAGDEMMAVENERKAREVANYRESKGRDVKLAQQQAAKLEDVFSQMEDGSRKSVNLLIKADVQGSAEAIRQAMIKMSNEEVAVKVVSSGVGGITATDVNLASTAGAIVLGFNVRADGAARDALKETGVELHYHSIIYEAIDQVKSAISGLLSPEVKEQIVGLAEVKDVFSSPKFGDIAGCMVMEGNVKRGLPIRVLRDNVVIYEGELESLRRFKDDVNEVRSGTECGIGVKNYNDVKPGDQIECFERFEVARTL
ncbi:MAG: translation initiation factor IF-2 [Pseudomonadota bacterium]